MKKITCLLLTLVMALTVAGCGSGGDTPSSDNAGQSEGEIVTELSEPVEIQFWHSISNQVHLEILENLVEEFNQTVGKEKGITVVPTFNGSSAELYSNVVASIKAGNAPDVILALRPYVADYLQTDYVVNLEPYIQDPDVGITDYEDIFANLRAADSAYQKEGTYSLPIHSYSEVLYYNVDFFEENGLTVPTTWDALWSKSRFCQIRPANGRAARRSAFLFPIRCVPGKRGESRS